MPPGRLLVRTRKPRGTRAASVGKMGRDYPGPEALQARNNAQTSAFTARRADLSCPRAIPQFFRTKAACPMIPVACTRAARRTFNNSAAGLLLAAGAAAVFQIPAEPIPAPDQVCARIDERVITRAEYGEYLVQVSGQGPLREMIKDQLLEREATRLSLAVSAQELEQAWNELWSTWLERRAGGDESLLLAELGSQGHDKASYALVFQRQKRREFLAQKIVAATRRLDEASLRARFEAEYGPGGLSTRVRQVLLSRLRTKNELVAQGRPASELTPEVLDALMRERAQAWIESLKAGAAFEEIAKFSHDVQGASNGGLFLGESWRRFGPEFVQAVLDCPSAAFAGPVVTEAGVHVIWVESRTQHEFGVERPRLLERAQAERPNFQELADLDARLWQASKIEIGDRKSVV